MCGMDLRDQDAMLDALVRVVGAARRDLTDDQSKARTHQDARTAVLTDLAAAAQRVDASLRPRPEHHFPAAAEHRRFLVRSHRDSQRPLLSLDEIAEAAAMMIDDTARA